MLTCNPRRVLLVIAAALLLDCSAEPPAVPADGQAVQVIVVANPADLEAPAYPGRAQAAQELNLGFQVAGRMLSRPVELGNWVRRGQLLAQLDLRDYRAARDRARAVRRRTSTRLARVREAAESGALSQQDLSEAEAQAEQARAAFAIRQKAVDDATLRAPFDGIVAATYAEPLQEVGAGEPILRLLDTSRIEMWIRVPEDRIDLAPNAKLVLVRFDALPGRVFSARIEEIGSEADDQTRTFPVNLLIEQPPSEAGTGRILPGMAGEATPQLPPGFASFGPEVPLSAVFSDATLGSYVWVVEASGATVELRAVQTGRLTDTGIVIREGLRPGERIVTQGSQFLSDGLEVNVVEPKGNAS